MINILKYYLKNENIALHKKYVFNRKLLFDRF